MLRPTLISCILTILLFTGCEESPTEVEASGAVAYTTFGGSFDDEGAAVVQTSDGGYLIVGNSYSGTGTSLTDLYAIKTDAGGDTTAISTQIFSDMTDATEDVTSFDLVSDVKVLADGSYILVGSKYDGTATGNNYDVWLVKLTAELTVDFSKTYGSTGNDFGYSVSLCDDNGFIIAGKTYNSANQNYDMWILKALSTGLLATADSDTDGGFGDPGTPGQVAIDGGVGNDAAYSASQTDDGGFIIAGEVRTAGGNADMIVLRLNPDGTLPSAPSAEFGNTDLSNPADGHLDAYIKTLSLDESAKFVQETSDGGFILVGNTFSGGSGQSDIYIVKVSDSGGPVWDRYIGSNRNDFANSIQQTTDGGFILTGSTYTSSSDILVTKIFPNSQGEVEWQYTMDGGYDDVGNYISQTSDGGYILTGSTYTSDGMNDVILIKLAANGSQEF